MNEKEKEKTIDWYNKQLEEYGVTEKGLGWGDKGRARLRYEILLSQWDFNSSSVLDFGCGFGDMFNYIDKKGFNDVSYTGVDINANFIAIAKEKYKDSATFILQDLFQKDLDQSYDFILSSGVFNTKIDNNMDFITGCFEKFNNMATKGFALNFLSDKVAFQYDYTFHSSPSVILDLAYKYSNNVVLRNDYMPFEFTVFVNKFSKINEKYTVYEDYVKFV